MIILSILIPTFNGKHRISALLLSLYDKGFVHSPYVEIIISDNASTDGTQDYLKQLSPEFSILLNETNAGYRGNAIRLLRIAKGKFTWLVGDDDFALVSCEELITLLAINLSSNCIFIESEEYDLIMQYPSVTSTLKMPFGFIGSSIQPNCLELTNLFQWYSGDSKYDSPHYFARWHYFLSHGKDSLVTLGNIRLLGLAPVLPPSKLFSLLSILANTFKNDFSFNWYHAYRYSLSCSIFFALAPLIKSQFNNQIHYDLTYSFARTSFYWFIRLPVLFIRYPRYATFMAKILIRCYLTVLTRNLLQP